MERNLNKFSGKLFDVLIIGGGISGTFVAWDAVLRGLNVALIEKGDFGAATSAASGKVIHGGIRYLQYGDIRRVRESIHERMIFQRIAPHLVSPIPFLIPTYGHWLKGKKILSSAMLVYDLLSYSQRRNTDPARQIPNHQSLSRKETLDMEPGIEQQGLTGGVLYYDCQMHNPERLTLSILQAANNAGAVIANYLKVTDLLREGQKVVGVTVTDVLNGGYFDIRSKVVLNAAGPWLHSLLPQFAGSPKRFSHKRLSKGIHIITPPLTQQCAVALASIQSHAKAVIQRGGRHYFIIPWRNNSIVGTTNVPFDGEIDGKLVTEKDIEDLIKDINEIYPGKTIRRDDVRFFYGGLYPDEINKKVSEGYQGARESQIYDHSVIDNINGLISCVGVKYTTSRKLAQKIVDLIFKKLGHAPPPCQTEEKAVYGGAIENFQNYLSSAIADKRKTVNKEILQNLIYNYGTANEEILNYSQGLEGWDERLRQDLPIIKAQVIHAVRKEMAQKLKDVIFRRTGLGTVGYPGDDAVKICASLMADEMGWKESRKQEEIKEVQDTYVPA